MAGMPKVWGMAAEMVEDHPALVFLAINEDGQQVKVAIAAEQWPIIVAEGQKRLDKIKGQSDGERSG